MKDFERAPGQTSDEAGAFVACLAETEPVLLDLLEVQPLFDSCGYQFPGNFAITQEGQIVMMLSFRPRYVSFWLSYSR